MSILIKGMEMPTDKMKNIIILSDGPVIQFSGYGNPKPLGTAVPVPPHGRLIDADALLKKCEFACTDDDVDVRVVRYSVIEAAPTIIEAEEGIK